MSCWTPPGVVQEPSAPGGNVCVKHSRIEQDQTLVKKQTVSVNTFNTINSTWGL